MKVKTQNVDMDVPFMHVAAFGNPEAVVIVPIHGTELQQRYQTGTGKDTWKTLESLTDEEAKRIILELQWYSMAYFKHVEQFAKKCGFRIAMVDDAEPDEYLNLKKEH